MNIYIDKYWLKYENFISEYIVFCYFSMNNSSVSQSIYEPIDSGRGKIFDHRKVKRISSLSSNVLNKESKLALPLIDSTYITLK